MLSRPIIVAVLLSVLASANAADKDYLQRGEREVEGTSIVYDRAIRDILSRGWRRDVVLRMLVIPPFEQELVAGISRGPDGCRAFSVTASKHIWKELGFGSSDPQRKKGYYHAVQPILHERPIPAPLAARIAALWRRVLADPKNYGKDPALYLDTDQFGFYVSFLPGEHLTAHTTGVGKKGEELWRVGVSVAAYAEGMTERDLVRDIAKAERKLGI